MKLTFLGATHEVTGSCYYIEGAGKKFLVDYGMEQGKNIYENEPIPVPAADLDFVLLTHAHIDHSGNLPILYAQGFRGTVYTTEATADLCDIMLRDSAHIQEFEAEWKNRKGARSGRPEFVPLFTMQDALGLIQLIQGFPYDKPIHICDGITVRFIDAGHLLGSASIELWITEEQDTKKLVFSGDIGNTEQPLIRDPQYISAADYVIMESTYGDRSHGERPDYVTSLAQIIQRTFDRGGNVVIPSFAVGRTQEMLYFIRQIKTLGLVHGHGDFPVYVDSPLAVEATTVFQKHPVECFDEEASALIAKGINPISFSNLHTAITPAESKAINAIAEPKVIISASGMCDAGRIKHHLKHNLWRPECTILFVGYQSIGTPGRTLVDGATDIRMFGEEIVVRASIQVLPGISGHADCNGLMKWIGAFATPPKKVFICHGESSVTEIFAQRVHEELGFDTFAPYSGTIFDLASGEFLKLTEGIPYQKNKAADGLGIADADAAHADSKTVKLLRSNTVFSRLVAAGYRLMSVIRKNEGGANKDLAKFTDQINALSDKWDR